MRTFVAGCILFLCGPVAAEVPFEQLEIDTGTVPGQTVLTGLFLEGQRADVAVLDRERRLAIYRFDAGGFGLAVEATLRDDATFVDVATIGGNDRLIVFGGGRLTWFDPASTSERELLAVGSDFTPPPRAEIPHVDVTHDVTGDGLDDLVVPDGDAFRIATQTADGFSEPVRVGVAPGPDRAYGRGGYRHDPWLQSGIHPVDVDRDGRKDLAVWTGRRFAVHRRDADGGFLHDADRLYLRLSIDGGRNSCGRRPELGFDAVESCYEADHGALTRGDRTEKMVHGFADLNGDGVEDLIVYSLTGRSIFSVQSTYEIRFGRVGEDGRLAFGSEVDASVPSDALQVALEAGDWDGDGQTDVVVTTFNVGFFKVFGALVSRSMTLGVDFFRMADGRYADEPDLSRRIKLDLSREVADQKAVAYAPILVGDVDGDGRADLLMAKGRKELRVYRGTGDAGLFADRPQKVKVAIPRGQEYVWLTDLDADGREEVLLHHPATEDEPGRVILLVAR